MTPLLLLAATLSGDPAARWKFVDETSHAGRSVTTYRTVELADAPAVPLHAADRPPAGAKFGAAGVGPGGRKRLAVVWHAATGTLWLDADGDGRFAAAERHALAAKPLEASIALPADGGSVPRTLLVRRRGDGVAWAVRGYTAGSVTVAGKPVAAMLTDGDADGGFDGAGVDRVWLDLDGDGAFDPLTEQFLLGGAVAANGTAVLVSPRRDGLGAAARERPSETGSLRVEVNTQPGAEVVELTANYVSEFGELVAVREAGKPVKLPVGKYRIDSAALTLRAADGKVWHYSFWSPGRKYDLEVTTGRRTDHAPLDGLKVAVEFAEGVGAAGAAPGSAVRVQPDVTNGGLSMSRCDVGDRFADYGRGVPAAISLVEPGSVVLDRCETGFT